MKKSFFTVSVCCILFFTLLHQAFPQADPAVNIPDTVLRGVIETKLGKNSGDTITESEMNSMVGTIRYADATDVRDDITDLTGLEHATGINGLSITGSGIISLSPLAALTNLTNIDFTNNPIVDITPLQNLTKLTNINFTNNPIVDITPLQNLTKLEQLSLRFNQITNIDPLKDLTSITNLSLQGNFNLSNISHLKSLVSLATLNLTSTSVTASDLLGVLPFFSSLDNLSLNYIPLSDLSALNALPVGTPLRVLSLQGLWDRSRSTTELGLLLKDISPLVDLMTAGKLTTGTPWISVAYNYNLDYESFYTHIQTLFEGGVTVAYKTRDPADGTEKDPEPGIERVSAENGVGRPRTRYTFVVQAYNRMHNYFSAFNSENVNYGPEYHRNTNFKGMPVTWTVTYPDGSRSEPVVVKTGDDGLARFTITLGSPGEAYTVDAVVPEKSNMQGPSHDEFQVSFTATADRNAPPPPPTPSTPPPPTVTFEDYPEDKPIEEFTLTIRFSEPVIGFEKDDITVETELTRGKGDPATLTELIPTTGHPAIGDLATDPAPLADVNPLPTAVQTYTATVELPARAIGTVTLIVRKDAATTHSELIGPEADTASEPIEFRRRTRIICPISVVPMDTVIFNEFRNAEDDTHDWVELKNVSDEPVSLKEWEISQVLPHAMNPIASHAERLAMDRDVVAFPDVTLPAGGILLIVNTHPNETDLIRGQNIERPNYNPDIFPQFLIAPEMKLPSTQYLLILRSVRDKNGQWDGFEDLVGDYHHDDVGYATNVWPLRCTPVYTGTGARFSEGKVYQRVMTQRFLTYKGNRTVPKSQGYFHEAWTLTEQHSGLGYAPGASSEISLGTPGYSQESVIRTTVGSREISISEVMYATDERASLSQWIELYNSTTEMVNLEGWQLRIEVRDHQPVHRHITFPFKSLAVMPRQTVLLVTQQDRNSGNIPMSRIYDVKRHHRKALLLREEGFALRLFSSDGTLVDMVGNLDGRTGRDKPRWELPSGWTETGERTSLIRRYADGVPMRGNLSSSWVRAVETSLLGAYTYWGVSSDNGTPGYRLGSPLPVTLSSLRADWKEGAVVVKWTTASEMANAGFHVLRSRDKASGFLRVSPALIPGAGTTAESQTYTYRDTTAAANVPYYYRLEEVSLSGERRAVATVRLRGHLSAANKRLYKWADVKSQD